MSELSMEEEYGPKVMPPVHPGAILREEFLEPMNLSKEFLAGAIGVDVSVIMNIVDEISPLSAELALLFSRFFGTSAELWVGLQTQYDLDMAEYRLGERLEAVVAYSPE